MTRAAHATAAATIAIAIVALLVSATYEPTESVAIVIGYLRAAAVAGTVATVVLHVGARIILEVRAAGAADSIQREGARLLRQARGE